MPRPMTVDGRVLPSISPATYQLVRQHLPRRPATPGVVWVADTCWVATYHDAAMRPEHFARWECLNPVDEITRTLPTNVWVKGHNDEP